MLLIIRRVTWRLPENFCVRRKLNFIPFCTTPDESWYYKFVTYYVGILNTYIVKLFDHLSSNS